MTSYVLITKNNEDTIEDILKNIPDIEVEDELIIFDNHSTDNTIPIIIGSINPNVWLDEDNRVKFYINNKEISYKETLEKAKSIAKGNIVEIRGEVEDVKN